MSGSVDLDDFATFPRARLVLKWHRRQLLSSLTTELRVRSEQSHGVASFKIPDLGLMPDDILEIMTPVRLPGKRTTDLFPAAAPAARVLELCDGSRMLAEIARRLVQENGWDEPYAFRYVRGVFLHLVTVGVCLPKGSATHKE